jgi:hypothetical protein
VTRRPAYSCDTSKIRTIEDARQINRREDHDHAGGVPSKMNEGSIGAIEIDNVEACILKQRHDIQADEEIALGHANRATHNSSPPASPSLAPQALIIIMRSAP